MPQGLGQMALAGAGRPHDQDRGLLGHEPAGGEIRDERVRGRRVGREVEAIQGLVGEHLGPAQALGELMLLAARHLVLDQERQEVGVGELSGDGLPVAGLQRVEDARQAQLL
jgi:hypothetical protein